MTDNGLKQRLMAAATQAGAQKVGFAQAGEIPGDVWAHYETWLREGYNGSMGYLSNYPEIRRDPRRLLDPPAAAGTIMVCAFSYYHPESQSDGAAQFAMYAHGSDYHEVLRKRLQPVRELLEDAGETARICIDTAPLMERYWAVQAGVGFIGRNRMLIVPQMGSYFFLAEIVTTASIAPDAPCTLTCKACGRCTTACPGGALRAASGFDARRCLSYLTIEHRGALPATIESPGGTPRQLRTVLANRVYGCDECQHVCPHNAAPPVTAIEEFRLRPALHDITKARIATMSQTEFSTIFAHSAVKRAKLDGLRRNASV